MPDREPGRAAPHILTPERIEQEVRHLLSQMTLDEKLGQMSGDLHFFPEAIRMLRVYNARPIPAGANSRLRIPALRFTDGPRGVVMYRSSCFPVSMARGASWDLDLEERIGDAIGVEARSQGANLFGGVCINLLRHPAWGRAQETYGEDPYHVGELGAALVRGVQRHLMACVKHYAANSIENTRFRVDVRIDERALREVYLPHFRRCLDEGAAAVMSAYNRVNGEYCSHNGHLLRDILKEEWGFHGFVVSDFVYAVHDATAALRGLDVEMPFAMHFGRRLRKLVRTGAIPEKVIDDAVVRILRQKTIFAQVGEPERYGPDAVVCHAHRALAREAARKSMVLLQNDAVPGAAPDAAPGAAPAAAPGAVPAAAPGAVPDAAPGGPLLPLDLRRAKRIALLGRLAATPNTGDWGSSQVRPPYVVTPLEGLRDAVGSDARVVFDAGRSIRRAAETARSADVAIVVVGSTYRDEGERMPHLLAPARGGDRDSLTLSARDEALVRAVAAANPRVVVVLMGGGPIITESWRARVPAILMAWYPGMEGGHALADILLGKENPSARLPCIFPRSADQLPFFDNNADTIEYALYHGYRLLDRHAHEPAFAFGFGLSYTSFAYGHLRLSADRIGPDGVLDVYVDVTNTGDRYGEEVVQLYVGCPASRVERPVRELKGFRKIGLDPGETRTVGFTLAAGELAYYDAAGSRWEVEPVEYEAGAGPSSRREDLLLAGFRVVGTG